MYSRGHSPTAIHRAAHRCRRLHRCRRFSLATARSTAGYLPPTGGMTGPEARKTVAGGEESEANGTAGSNGPVVHAPWKWRERKSPSRSSSLPISHRDCVISRPDWGAARVRVVCPAVLARCRSLHRRLPALPPVGGGHTAGGFTRDSAQSTSTRSSFPAAFSNVAIRLAAIV
jgi:hypothetical protein